MEPRFLMLSQGRFDSQGVSFANALVLSRHYIEAYAWTK